MFKPAHSGNLRISFLLKILIGIVAAAALVLWPQAAVAQHGGGGHGGGGGGGHAAGGSHGGGSAKSGGAAHQPATGTGAANGANSTGSHVWGGAGGASGAREAMSQRFAAGNNTWQEPPHDRWGGWSGSGSAAKSSAMVPQGVDSARHGTALGSRVLPLPPRIFVPRHRVGFGGVGGFGGFGFFGGGCFNGFFPGFCGSALWWGPGWAWGPSCDPDWGCDGFGYLGYDTGGGYQPSENGDTISREIGPFSPRSWPANEPVGDGEAAEKRPVISKPTVTIYLRDGSSYGVTDYWLADGNLHYVTSYGGENSIPVEQLDLQRTVDENAARGVNFTLYNEPSREK